MFISFVSEVSTLGNDIPKIEIYKNCCILIGVLLCVYKASIVVSYWVLHELLFPLFRVGKQMVREEEETKSLKIMELEWEDILERLEYYLKI